MIEYKYADEFSDELARSRAITDHHLSPSPSLQLVSLSSAVVAHAKKAEWPAASDKMQTKTLGMGLR